jgi:hypothetical protein
MCYKLFIKIVISVTVTVTVISIITISSLMNAGDPRVVFIYTQKEKIPDIAFKVSSVPLAIASYLKLGTKAFALYPATAENIERALLNVEFLVIGTHGIDGMVYSDEKALIGPMQTPNPKMRSVYFGSCYFGTKRQAWETMFPNARVIGYDTKTYKSTGWLYLVFESWKDLLAVTF